MEIVINNRIHLSIDMAAKELATTRLRLLMLIKRGALAATMENGEWFVAVDQLDSCHGLVAAVEPSACRSSCNASTCGCKGG